MPRSHSLSTRDRRLPLFVALVAAATWSLCPAPVKSADAGAPPPIQRQTREYTISIDGTPRGSSKTQFKSSKGVVLLRSESEIKINYLVYRYHYISSGTELWRNGHIASLENAADYNGTHYAVKGSSTARGLALSTNGTVSLVSPEVWDTSYLLLPERLARPEATPVTLLDSDQGTCKSGKVQYVGDEVLEAADRRVHCMHYRITGDVDVEVWYDRSRRLVRQESQERGHKVRFELVSVTAE
jgi:hypothetical protein